jgi:hypothetical protein
MMSDALFRATWSSTSRKAITSFLATVAAVAGAFAAIPPAWTALGLPEVASHTYVTEAIRPVRYAQEQSETKLTGAINRLYQSQKTLYRSQLEQARNLLEESLYRAKHDPAAASSETVQEHIRDLQQKINETTTKLNTLQNE